MLLLEKNQSSYSSWSPSSPNSLNTDRILEVKPPFFCAAPLWHHTAPPTGLERFITLPTHLNIAVKSSKAGAVREDGLQHQASRFQFWDDWDQFLCAFKRIKKSWRRMKVQKLGFSLIRCSWQQKKKKIVIRGCFAVSACFVLTEQWLALKAVTGDFWQIFPR